MMKKIFVHNILLCFLFILNACQNGMETIEPDGNVRLVLLNIDQVSSSRAIPSELENPLTSEFQLKVVSKRDAKTVYEGAFLQEMVLRPGLYDIHAYYGDDSYLMLDNPCYAGVAENVEVESGKNVSVNIPCKVSNALFSVVYTNESNFGAVYSDYYVTVHVGSQSIDIKDVTKSAYFKAGSLVGVVFHGTRKDTGALVEIPLKQEGQLPRVMNAAQHLKISLSVDVNALSFDVIVNKTEVSTVTINETIPVEWLPKPKLESVGFVNNEISFAETETKETAKLNFRTASTVQDVKLLLSFEDPNMKDYNGEYLLSVPEQAEQLQRLGIDIDGTGVNFMNLTNKLQTIDGVSTSNLVTVDVMANNRWSSEDKETNRTYILKCNKPEFTVIVDPVNVWTKEFTISDFKQENVTTGNFVRLSKAMKYQYRFDDGDWLDCDKKVAFANFPQNKNIKVRAVYRDCIYSPEIPVTLESPDQLPNGNMEQWHFYKAAKTINTYNPWNKDAQSFWNTNNEYTTRYRSKLWTAPYNCFPAVSYVPHNGNDVGNLAAEIRSTAAGSGNTLPANVLVDNRVPGQLFVGDFPNYAIKEGKAFSARPTELKFSFKYSPVSNSKDKFRVYIKLMDTQNNIIADGELTSDQTISDWANGSIALNYNGKTQAKCTKIYVNFSSSIHSGSSMPYSEYYDGYSLWENKSKELKDASRTFIGSILTIDDIELVYGK